jgi:hypothetical protein
MRTNVVVLCIGVVALMATAAPAEEKVHELRASPGTVHRSFFDASLKPVLTIDSGDIVRLWTTTGNPRYFERLGVPKEKIPAELYAAFERGHRAPCGTTTRWTAPLRCAVPKSATPWK